MSNIYYTNFAKKTFINLMMFLLFNITNFTIAFSQSIWSPQNSGTSQDLRWGHFLSENTGWISGNGGVILKTTNGRTNWVLQPSGITNSIGAIYFVDSLTGWFGADGGKISKTTNGGINWVPQTSNVVHNLLSMKFLSSTTGYIVGMGGTVLKTTNGGTNWINKSFGITNGLLTVCFVNELTGWVTGDAIKIYKTTDGGDSFIQQNTDSEWYKSIFFLDSLRGWASAGMLTGVLYKTSNGGTNWVKVIPGSGLPTLYSVCFANSLTGFTVGGNGTIYNTVNGGSSWSPQNSGTTRTLYFTSFPGTVGWASGILGTILKYSLSAWSFLQSIPQSRYAGAGCSYVRNDTGFVFISGGDIHPAGGGTLSNTIYSYNEKTNSWSLFNNLPVSLWFHCQTTLKDTVYIIGGATSNTNVVNTVYKLNVRNNTILPVANLPSERAFMKAVSYQDSLIYVAGGVIQGGETGSSSVFLYNSKTNTWRNATSLTGARCGFGMAIKGDTIVIVCGSTNFSSGLTNSVLRGVINQNDRSVITWSSGAVYPGTGRFAIESQIWKDNNIIVFGGQTVNGFTSAVNECYLYRPATNQWIPHYYMPGSVSFTQSGVIRYSNNLWKLFIASGCTSIPGSIPNTIMLTDSSSIITNVLGSGNYYPENFYIKQNYPNPFNPVTNIKFGIPKNSFVILKVYDVMGREVKTLVNETKSNGNYSIDFNGSDLTSGVYFYRIQAEEYTDVKKMILVK